MSLAEPVTTTPPTSTTPVISSTSTTTSSPAATSSAAVNNTDPITVVLANCSFGHTYCSKVQRAAETAAAELAQVVNIKVGITQVSISLSLSFYSCILIQSEYSVKLEYFSFCDRSCANDTYGFGVPGSQFALNAKSSGVDRNYIYPQTLARQLVQFIKISTWADYDVRIAINHDVYMNAVDLEAAKSSGWNGTGVPPGGKYWFQGDGDIGDNQVDMVYIILHELIHGIGFISSWAAYFYIPQSPYYKLVEGIFEEEELRLVTPEPTLYIPGEAGQAYITGFESTMIFDKFLNVTYESLNETDFISLQNFTMTLQNFCLQRQDAFVINFLHSFLNEASESRTSAQLFKAMSTPGTVTFNFRPTSTNDSVYMTDAYLNTTYSSNLTLLTGDNLVHPTLNEYTGPSNPPGLAISHLTDDYTNSLDFIMTGIFPTGSTLEELVNEAYKDVSNITYHDFLPNGTMVPKVYRSPIGPGILRVLDAMGFSTVLARTDPDRETIDDDNDSQQSCDWKWLYPKPPQSTSSASLLVPASFFTAPAIYYHFVLLLLVICII
ncbi:hypothetical protein LRAMOSA10709 [Lichtheimia ramosa]|uniref:Uncharacterized protein n=1 Tax=Lichtheimia ramosa TaxID=688394 RepID=A0A077WQC1_9FUNG|nr:hypothetical protein LRAMOSA10709 [Lichtheimia ramosa]